MLGERIVAGIGGGSASGKTLLAEGVVARLGADAVLISHDGYYFDVPTGSPHPNFDHPDALDTRRLVADLQALRQGNPIHPPAYDFTSHRRLVRDPAPVVQPVPVVLVEGILVLAIPELRAQFDDRIFVDTPESVRLERRLQRDRRQRGRHPDDARRQFERDVQPMHHAFVAPSRQFADLVLDGTLPVATLVDRFLTHLRRDR